MTKQIRIFYLSVFLLLHSNALYADLVWSWQQGPETTYAQGEEIVISGTLFNHLNSTVDITGENIAGVGYSLYDATGPLLFNLAHGPGPSSGFPDDSWEFYAQFDGMTLFPGESFEFIFGRMTTDQGIIPDGIYHFGASLNLRLPNGDTLPKKVQNFRIISADGVVLYAPVVPIPPSIWLFVTGLLSMLSLRYRHVRARVINTVS